MKTPKLLITCAVAAFATVNLLAADVALSPRSSDHQSRSLPGINNDPNLAAANPAPVSPRLLDRQAKTAVAESTAVSPSLMCVRQMTGSPKIVGACADHPGAAMPCCSVAASK